METRTSHSSPCFLRVADANAASSASKMISLSTLFSLETASTTNRISLFTSWPPAKTQSLSAPDPTSFASRTPYIDNRSIYPSKRRQSRPSYLRELYAHGEIIHFHLDALAVRTTQHARVPLAPVARYREL